LPKNIKKPHPNIKQAFPELSKISKVSFHTGWYFCFKQIIMKDIILKDLAKAKEYTCKVAEAMPEKQFDFTPAADVMSFRELIHHIAYSLLWINENFLKQTETPWAPAAIPATKKELSAYLVDAFNRVEADIQKISLAEDVYTSSFYFMIEHNAHHRGQAVTYLRCTGITPPQYPF
jgi:uncharacterized damage-inducible protein DinB